jgi:3-hydroxyacyl-CoA dehydrogenase
MFVFKAAVVGAGAMGSEIAQTIASAEIPVVLKDVDQKSVDAGLENARSLWQGRVDAGKMEAAERDRKLALITGATDYAAFGDVDFVVEAVPERMGIKQTVFAELDEVTPGHAILSSNTSSLSITEMGDATSRPDKVVGFHVISTASRLIEVIEGEDTDPETVQAAISFAQRIRKMPIRCSEAPGFVVNRILNSSVSELWRFQEETGIDVKELDRIVGESKAAPMGPFFMTDLLGLDTVLHVAEHLRDSYGDRFFVHRPMQDLVAAGDLGAKTGKGFYEHGMARAPGDQPRPEAGRA